MESINGICFLQSLVLWSNKFFQWAFGTALKVQQYTAYLSSQGHKSCQQNCSSLGFSFHGATDPARSLLQCGLPPPSAIHQLWHGVLHQLEDGQPQQMDSWPHHGLHMGYQEISQCLEHRLPCFFTDYGVCGAWSFMYSQSCLQLLLCSSFFHPS